METPSKARTPQMVVRRLSIYYRSLSTLQQRGVSSISSDELSQLTGFTAAQVRRDLAYFGNFGRRGVGYDVETLRNHLRDILGIGIGWPMALVGVGNLGSALLAYEGFSRQGFHIVAAFDADPRRIGMVVRDVAVEPMANMPQRIQELGIVAAIMTVPAKAAQQVADQLIAAGVRYILNFAPVRLEVPAHVHMANVDLSIEVEYLSYLMRQERQDDGAAAPKAGRRSDVASGARRRRARGGAGAADGVASVALAGLAMGESNGMHPER
jgi:redox-sensing transcriptional repressor